MASIAIHSCGIPSGLPSGLAIMARLTGIAMTLVKSCNPTASHA